LGKHRSISYNRSDKDRRTVEDIKGDELVSSLFEAPEDADFWQTSAYRLVKSQVKLLWQENVSETSLATQIADTVVGQASSEDKHVGITFFAQLSGQPQTMLTVLAACRV